MGKIRFILPQIWINDDIINDMEEAEYRSDYDVYTDWINYFAKGIVNEINKNNFPFEIKFSDTVWNEAGGYDIAVTCDEKDLYNFFDKYLIDTKQQYDIDDLIRNINVYPAYGDQAFEEAWNNAYDETLGDFMDKVYNRAKAISF